MINEDELSEGRLLVNESVPLLWPTSFDDSARGDKRTIIRRKDHRDEKWAGRRAALIVSAHDVEATLERRAIKLDRDIVTLLIQARKHTVEESNNRSP